MNISEKLTKLERYGKELPKEFLMEILIELENIKKDYERRIEELDFSNGEYFEKEYDNFYDISEFTDGVIFETAMSSKRYKLPNSLRIDFENFSSWDEVYDYIKKKYKPIIIEYVSMTDHGGLYFELGQSSGWDTGVVGFIILTREKMREYGVSLKEAKKIFYRQVNDLLEAMSGNVYVLSTPFDRVFGVLPYKEEFIKFLEDNIAIVNEYIKRVKSYL